MIEQRVLTLEPFPLQSVPAIAVPPQSPPADHDVGDLIYIVYWRPIPMPGVPKNGAWDVMSAQVVSAGAAMICCEIHIASTASWCGGAWEATIGSLLRFVKRDRVFRVESEATAFAKSLVPPA